MFCFISSYISNHCPLNYIQKQYTIIMCLPSKYIYISFCSDTRLIVTYRQWELEHVTTQNGLNWVLNFSPFIISLLNLSAFKCKMRGLGRHSGYGNIYISPKWGNQLWSPPSDRRILFVLFSLFLSLSLSQFVIW